MPAGGRGVPVFKIAAMYAGAVIGAGFASGQEIMQFFTVYGTGGLWAAAVAAFLLAYLGASTLYLAARSGSTNYLSLLSRLTTPRVAKVFDFISIIMLLAGLSVMLAGSGAVFKEYLGIPAWPGVVLLLLVNCLVLAGGMSGVLHFNSLLVPAKIAAIATVSILVLCLGQGDMAGTAPAPLQSAPNWLLSGVLYVSYNMILVVAVLSTLGDRVTTGRALAGGVAGGAVLGAAILVVLLAELKLYPGITGYQVPLLFMAGEISNVLRVPVAILIWLAILTTAVANAHGLAARFAPPGSVKYKLAGVGCTLLALPMAGLDFDRLVGTVYPAFGYVGLLLIIILGAGPLVAVRHKNRL